VIPIRFAQLLGMPQLQYGRAPRFAVAHPGGFIFLGERFQVIAQLVVEFVVEVLPGKDSTQAGSDHTLPVIARLPRSPSRAHGPSWR